MAWSVLQSKSATVSSGNGSVTFTTANLTAGSKVVCWVEVSASTSPQTAVSSVKDGAGNIWTQLRVVSNNTSGALYLFALDTPAGDAGTKPTLTATVSANFGVTMVAEEVSGLLAGNTSAMLDGTPGIATGTASPAATGSLSTAVANEFLAAAYGDPGDAVTVSNATGYTADANNVNANGNATLFADYKNSTGGSESASWTLSGSAVDGWNTILAAFKLAAAASPSLPPAGARRTASRTPGLPPVRRYRQMLPVPKQLNPPYVFTEIAQHREEWPRGFPRRSRITLVVPAQLNPPFPFAELAQHRETWPKAMPRRGRAVAVVPAQLNPPLPVAESRQVRRGRGFMLRSGRTVTPVPSQQSAPANPAFVPQPSRHLRLAALPRRGRVTVVPAGQHAVTAQRRPLRGFAEAVRRSVRIVLAAAGVPGPSFTVGTLTAADQNLATVTAADAALATLTADDSEGR